MLDKLEAISEIAEEVNELWKGRIGTHYDGCYAYHVECLAFYIRCIINREESN